MADPAAVGTLEALPAGVAEVGELAGSVRRRRGAHGLLRASFVPPEPIRDLRDLTRARTCITQERSREVQRLEKLLESAGIKLSSVATDITGVSGRLMLQALIDSRGTADPAAMADLAKRRMRSKIPVLTEALNGRFTAHHAFMTRLFLDRIDAHTRDIQALSAWIDELMRPFLPARELLESIPGFSRVVAEVFIAETGGDMTQFPTPGQLASLAGVSPGSNESAGRVKSTKTRPGNRYLKGALGTAALNQARTKLLLGEIPPAGPRRGPMKALGGAAGTRGRRAGPVECHPSGRIGIDGPEFPVLMALDESAGDGTVVGRPHAGRNGSQPAGLGERLSASPPRPSAFCRGAHQDALPGGILIPVGGLQGDGHRGEPLRGNPAPENDIRALVERADRHEHAVGVPEPGLVELPVLPPRQTSGIQRYLPAGIGLQHHRVAGRSGRLFGGRQCHVESALRGRIPQHQHRGQGDGHHGRRGAQQEGGPGESTCSRPVLPPAPRGGQIVHR